MGRKRIEINLDEVARLAGQGLTEEEIAAALGISTDTLERRKKESADFAAAIKSGRARAADEVSNALMDACRKGNVTAIIWYEKTRRGLSDKSIVEQASRGIDWEHVPDDLRDAFLDGKLSLNDVRRELATRTVGA